MSEFREFGKIARLNRDIVITEKLDGTNAQILFEEIKLESDAPGVEGHGRGGNVPVGDELTLIAETRETTQPGDEYHRYEPTGRVFSVLAGKRTSWVHPRHGKNWDNYGFGAWVLANAAELFALLGPGKHFGEWWGAGVQRRYGVANKRFSLFNVAKYGAAPGVLDPRCVTTAGTDGTGGELIVHKFHNGVKQCACRPAQEDVRATIGGVDIAPVPVLYRGPWFGTLKRTDAGGNVYPCNGYVPAIALQKLETEGSVAAPGFMDPEGIVVFHEASGQLFKATIKGDEKPKGAQ